MTAQQGGKDELSRTLAALRADTDLSTRQVAAVTGFSQAKVSRLERGINVPTEADVGALLDAYRAPANVRKRLVGLARDIKAEHRPVVLARNRSSPGVFQARLRRIEEGAARVRAFSPTAVPGLLQTPAYVRALIAARDLPQAEVERFVANRLHRQELLTRPTTPQITLITTEGALGWRLGSRKDMAEQVEHIAAMTAHPELRVGIIPWGTRAERVALHAWDIYDDRAVSYGTADATAILTETRDVARYIELHEMVERMAVYGDAARAVLDEIATRYRLGRGGTDSRRGGEQARGSTATFDAATET